MDNMKDEIEDIMGRIKGNLIASDKNLILLIFDSFNQRLTRLEKSLKPNLYSILNLIIESIKVIAMLILAYTIWKLNSG